MSDAAAAKKAEEKPKEVATAKHDEKAAPKVKKDFIPLFTFTLVTLNVVMLGVMGFFLNKMWVRVQDLTVRAQSTASAMHGEEGGEAGGEHAAADVHGGGHGTAGADAHGDGHGTGKEMTANNQGTLFPMESFLVNITSDQGPKYLQAQIELELSDATLEDEVTRKKAAIRDAIIILLSSRSYRELREANGMKVLRVDILKSVNNLLSTGKVREIFFTQFHFN